MGYERYLEKKNCCCGAKPSELHETVGCDDEQCPLCGLPFSSVVCDHAGVVLDGRVADRMPWTGVLPMLQEAADYGFFVRWEEVSGTRGRWVACGKDHPEAMPSPNEVVLRCRWDPKSQRFVLKGKRSA